MDSNELYFIFSMTKMLTCTVALQLYEQGKYQMSDPITKYMPEFTKMKISDEELNFENAAKITIDGLIEESVESNLCSYVKKSDYS